MRGEWFEFVYALLGGGTKKWYCTYKNYRIEDFFFWCDVDFCQYTEYWDKSANDNDYCRLHPPT